MLNFHQTRKLSRYSQIPSFDCKRRFSQATLFRLFVVISAFFAVFAWGTFGRAIEPSQKMRASGVRAVSMEEPQELEQFDFDAEDQGLFEDANAPATPTQPAISETTKNERNAQKTFQAPTDKNAALVGAFLLRLLPDALREQTSWRYDEKNNTLTIYGPERALELSEKLLSDFSEPLYESFLESGEFVGIAGVAPRNEPKVAKAPLERNAPNETYYDAERNEVVKVAYEAEGAIIPDRQEYAVTFGAGDVEQTAAVVDAARDRYDQTAQNARDFIAENAEAKPDDSSEFMLSPAQDVETMLDVVVYRCLPSASDRVEKLLQSQFGQNSEIAFSVDRRLGTIVVHANLKRQEEVRNYLALLEIYPARNSSREPDLRVATGVVSPIEGDDAKDALQAFGTRPSNGSFGSGSLNDVYRPQHRQAVELQETLLQLFGKRLQRLSSKTKASYSQNQVATYRFVKQRLEGEKYDRSCDVSIDGLHNQISVQGDGALCSQMLVLLRAMDQPPLRNGNVRRFIPIRNVDSRKLRQIFEYGTKKNAANSPKRGKSVAFVNYLEPTNEDRASLFDGLTKLTAFDPNFAKALDIASSPSLTGESALESAFEAIDALTSEAQTSVVKKGVRQVAYQEDEGLGSLSGIETTPEGRRIGTGVGVVQDFTPTVLTDLDVVIVDNATDAEFERIKQMIEQIEELAKIAEITTEIYNLEHVDCTMLHGVLTTLYSEMFTTKQGRVVFYALQNPNAILIAGWGQAFEDMKNLIELFDQPIKEGAGTMRVVRLKYASVDEIAALLTDTFTTPATTGTGGFAPRIRAFADVRTNSLVVQASPNDWEEIQKILLELDVNQTTTKLSTRVFPLKNSLAEDIRTTIMNAILPAKQGTLDTSAAKFPVLELLSVDASGRKLVESGIMMDVDVTADVYHNQLIVNAPDDCMEFMARLIELLDVAPKKAQIRFFQVRHGDASQIMKTLQSLLATSDSNLSTPTIPQAEGEETFVPVRFALDTRTNVIIAAAAPKELAIVDALVVALDVKDKSEREEVVIQLRNIQALVVAQAIDDYLSQKQALETTSEVLSTYQLYESQVIVIPESISNSIIVSASPEQMDGILEMIKTFDKDPPQVVIQVLIAEVTLTNAEEFGIETGLQDKTSFDRSTVTSVSGAGNTYKPGYDIINGGGVGKNYDSDTNPTNIAGQVLNNFGMGTSNTSLGYGGFVVSASSRSVELTLRMLREKNRLQVLSRPQVTAMDNQQAFILVGQRVPRITNSTMTNYGVQNGTTDTPVGLILLVTPRVTNDGRVVMEIGAEKSNLGNEADAVSLGNNIKQKTIDTIQAMTAISARDGETVMLGGLLTSEREKVSKGVPYLSDIPLLGWLFRFDAETVQRKELLIVMTPRIMRDSKDFHENLRLEMHRTNIDLDEAMGINGNMGLYDPRTGSGQKGSKRPRSLVNDLVHMDKMDEVTASHPYSPAQDYEDRPSDYYQNAKQGYRSSKRSESDDPTIKRVKDSSQDDQAPLIIEGDETGDWEEESDEYESSRNSVSRSKGASNRASVRETASVNDSRRSNSQDFAESRTASRARGKTSSRGNAKGISGYVRPREDREIMEEDEDSVQTASADAYIRGQVSPNAETEPSPLLSLIANSVKFKPVRWIKTR